MAPGNDPILSMGQITVMPIIDTKAAILKTTRDKYRKKIYFE